MHSYKGEGVKNPKILHSILQRTTKDASGVLPEEGLLYLGRGEGTGQYTLQLIVRPEGAMQLRTESLVLVRLRPLHAGLHRARRGER